MAPKTDTTAPAAQGNERFFTQEEVNQLLESARTQEKDKLYPTISKADERVKAMDEELKELRKFQKAQEKIEADRLKAIENAQKAKEEAEMSARELVERRNQEFDARLAELQAENERRVASMEMEIKFQRQQAYIQRRAMEEQNNIAPELMDFITGDDEAQVEASIELLKAKTAQIMENIKNAQRQQRAGMPGVAPSSGTNGVTPLDQPGDRQVTAEDIRGMSMSEFAALRKRIGMPSASGRGLFDL